MSGANQIIPLIALGVATGGAALALAPVAAGAAAAGTASAGTAAASTAAASTAAAASSSIFTASNLALLSAGVSAAGSVAQGMAGQAAKKAEAAGMQMQASAERAQQASEDLARARRLNSVLSMQRASFAAGGVSFASGSPLNFASQSIGSAGEESTQSGVVSNTRQAIFSSNAKSARRAGTLSLIGGLTDATGTLTGQYARNRRYSDGS